MNTIQLTRILRKDKYTRGVFQGVYPSDKLPTSISSYPALFIANVDTSEKPGSHWVAFYFTENRKGAFFIPTDYLQAVRGPEGGGINAISQPTFCSNPIFQPKFWPNLSPGREMSEKS